MNTPAVRLGNTINVTEIVDNSPFTPLHWRSFTLCMACLVMDGFDVQVLGYTAPSIVRDWGVSAATLGPVFAAANFGVLLGALFISMLADRIGRRPVIVAAALFVGVMTILTGRVTSVPQLLVMRFLTGIGLGTIVSNASSLVGEYGSKRMRATLIMYSGVGFTGGAAFGGFVATALIPAYGWQSVFYFGGAVPLVIGLIMLVALPESLQCMALRGKSPAKLAMWLNQVDPSVKATANDEFVVREENKAGVPIRHLFREGRALATVVFWVVNFMNLLNLYSLASWLPTVVRRGLLGADGGARRHGAAGRRNTRNRRSCLARGAGGICPHHERDIRSRCHNSRTDRTAWDSPFAPLRHRLRRRLVHRRQSACVERAVRRLLSDVHPLDRHRSGAWRRPHRRHRRARHRRDVHRATLVHARHVPRGCDPGVDLGDRDVHAAVRRRHAIRTRVGNELIWH